MSAATSAGAAPRNARVPWVDVVVSAVAAVSWALIAMTGTAALGLRLLDADAAGALGPMTAAVVALGAGGSVTPSGDVSAFGLSGAEATTAVEITPLGVSLVGALLLALFFLRSLRAAGPVVTVAELLARAGAVVALCVAMAGGLVWAGHDVVTLDGRSLGLDGLPGGDGGGIGLPGPGGLGDVEGLLPDRVADLVDAQAAVGFTVDTAPTLLGAAVWSAGVLVVALLASRRTPLPRGWDALHRVVRPAVSAVVTVLLLAVAAGLATAGYAAVGDPHPRRIAGAALLGAPNGVWLGLPVGLFVPWDGRASGALLGVLPHPLDDLLRGESDQPVTLGRLAELDGRVWLLGVAAAVAMLLAGVLVAVRTPVAGGRDAGAPDAGTPAGSVLRCALRLALVTAVALAVLVRLTGVSVDASLSVLGFDAFGAGLELHGRLGPALLLGAAWGAAAGTAGALLARAAGATGAWAAPLARGDRGATEGDVGVAGAGGPVSAAGPAGSVGAASAASASGAAEGAEGAGRCADGGRYGEERGASAALREDGAGSGSTACGAPRGPYAPEPPYRPPNPDTNPYLRMPDGVREPRDAPRSDTGPGRADGRAQEPAGGWADGRAQEPTGGWADGWAQEPRDAPRSDTGTTPADGRAQEPRDTPRSDTGTAPADCPAQEPAGGWAEGPADGRADARRSPDRTRRLRPPEALGPAPDVPPPSPDGRTRALGTTPWGDRDAGHRDPSGRAPSPSGKGPGPGSPAGDGHPGVPPPEDGTGPGTDRGDSPDDDLYGAPTQIRRVEPPRRGRRSRPARGRPSWPDEPPPPPPPPPAPRGPDGR
ncbi:streptophobe family protein [Streptomyces sp. NPDC012461]|uniref:streptophobe family protein n=1 Tax=Streptomyces sp. NPDC012461 TaxID=3155117 RepID=UPI003405DD9F